MMRKGDLAEYSPEWVLRTAAQEGVDGGIEFDVGRRISVYLTGGRIYLVLADGDPEEVALDEDLDDHAFAAAVEATEHRLLPHALDLLVELLGSSSGEYFHHPLNEHALNGEWDWDTVDLVDEAGRRIQAEAEAAAQAEAARLEAEQAAADGVATDEAGDEVEQAADPAGSEDDMITASHVPAPEGDGEAEAEAEAQADVDAGPAAEGDGEPGSWGDDSMVCLTGTVPDGELGADAWSLVAAMADTIPVPILASRLGWTTERLAGVLDEMRAVGAVREESFDTPAFTPPASAAG